jgi:hypothetical protein
MAAAAGVIRADATPTALAAMLNANAFNAARLPAMKLTAATSRLLPNPADRQSVRSKPLNLLNECGCREHRFAFLKRNLLVQLRSRADLFVHHGAFHRSNRRLG